MKNIAKRISAFLAAAVMTISGAGISAFATPAPDPDDGWIRYETGNWAYLAPGSKHLGIVCDAVYTIDGIVYRFDAKGICKGKYSGMAKKDGILRRYENGLPYTGWTKRSDGSWKYYLDGYSVTGDLQIGNIIYSFDENGVYTGNGRTAKFSADVVGTVSSDADKIMIKVSSNDKTDTKYVTADPDKMERWENGKWVSCIGDGVEYVVDDLGYVFSSKNSNTVSFYPKNYTNSNFTTGYYRISLSCWADGKYNTTKQDLCAVFEVLPPVTVELRKDLYISDGRFDVPVETVVNINSEKLKKYYSQHPDEISVEFDYHRTDYWGPVNTYDSDTIIEAEAYENGKPMKVYLTDIVSGVNSAGHYKAVVTVNGEKYTREFLIDKLVSKAWLDEYNSKDDKLTINFTLFNNTKKDITINPDVYTVYEQKDGKWSYVSGEVAVDALLRKEIIKPDEKYYIEFPMYQYYIDRSKFEPGIYAVNIGGWGFAEFALTDNKPDLSETPYANLSEDNIKKIQLNTGFSSDDTLSAEFTGYEARQLVHILRQIRIYGDAEETFSGLAGTFRCEIKIIYNDGTTKTVVFRDSEILEYKGKKVFCAEYPYHAIEDILDKKPDVKRSWEKVS